MKKSCMLLLATLLTPSVYASPDIVPTTIIENMNINNVDGGAASVDGSAANLVIGSDIVRPILTDSDGVGLPFMMMEI